jgi:hypothetical protein
VAAWRRAEAVVYPSVMVDATLYQQYVQVVREIVDELREVDTEDELVRTWHEQRDLGRDALARLAPSMGPLMDAEAVRDAAFCQRHRETTRERAKEIARERLEQARRDGAEWVVLFDDVTPLGSQAPGNAREAVREARRMGSANRTCARPFRKGLTK